jgi:aminoglycoside phosphotransferase (APT) family kinase protein
VPERRTIEWLHTGLAGHPAALAWGRFRREPVAPARIAVLKETSKSGVYRLEGAAPGGGSVVAKRCGRKHLGAERSVYEQVLPHLDLPVPAFYGALEEDEYCWLFLEDAGEDAWSPGEPEHRSLAARWLGRLHASAAGLAALGRLPDRGPRHYREHLRSARDALRRGRENPALTADDRRVLADILSLLDRAEAGWGAVEASSAAAPQTLVHGDFARKNVRLRAGPTGAEVVPLDWETAGRGVPAADLAWLTRRSCEDGLATYRLAVRAAWPQVGLDEVRRLARLGRLFRLLACVDWSSRWLAEAWPEKPLRDLRGYQADLSEALRSPHGED